MELFYYYMRDFYYERFRNSVTRKYFLSVADDTLTLVKFSRKRGSGDMKYCISGESI